MRAGGREVGCLSVCLPVLARLPGCGEPYRFVFGQPVRDAQAADLCCDLLPVSRLGDTNGRKVLGTEEAHWQEAGTCLWKGVRLLGGLQQLTSGVMRLMVGRS